LGVVVLGIVVDGLVVVPIDGDPVEGVPVEGGATPTLPWPKPGCSSMPAAAIAITLA